MKYLTLFLSLIIALLWLNTDIQANNKNSLSVKTYSLAKKSKKKKKSKSKPKKKDRDSKSKKKEKSEEIEEIDTKNLVKKTVAVIDFVNQNKKKEYDFLGRTISLTLTEQLRNAKSLNVIAPDETKDTIKKLNLINTRLDSTASAVKIGKAEVVDAVIVGNFSILNSEIKIFANVIDVETGKTRITKSMEDTASGVLVFPQINTFAKTLTTAIKKEFKPEEVRRNLLKYTFIFPKEEFSDSIKTVMLEGDFNGWKAEPMDRTGDNFTKEAKIDIVSKDTYEYRYVINGKREEENRRIKFKLVNGKLVEDKDLFKPTIGLKAGYLFTIGSMGDRIDTGLLIAGAYFQMHLPFIDEKFGVEAGLSLFNYMSNEENEENYKISGWDVTTNNIYGNILFFYEIKLMQKILFIPKLGFGSMYQSISIESNTGETDIDSKTNFMPTAQAEILFSYRITKNLSANLGYSFIAAFDPEEMIFFNSPIIGVTFQF